MEQVLTSAEYKTLRLFRHSSLSLSDNRVDRNTTVALIRRKYLVPNELCSIPFSDSIVVGSAVVPKNYTLSKAGRDALTLFAQERRNRRLKKAGAIAAVGLPILISIIALIAEHGNTIASWFMKLFSR